mgnify:CR=1 FL=1
MKKKNIWELASCLLVVAVVLAAFYFYQYLPDKIVTHWNAAGEADGWGSKNMQIIFLPLLILFVHLLFKLLPKIDPKKKNYEKFANVYGIFRVAIVGYLAIIYFLTGFFLFLKLRYLYHITQNKYIILMVLFLLNIYYYYSITVIIIKYLQLSSFSIRAIVLLYENK